MTTYLNNYESDIYSTNYNDIYNGVARVSTGEHYGTGSLLYDGKSIITAAHIFTGYTNRNATVYFDTDFGVQALNATITLYEEYDSTNQNGDIAILTLEENATSMYERYNLYRDNDEMGEIFTAVGYGSYGSGSTGALINETDILKLKIQNTFDSDFYTIYNSTNTNLAWIPLENSILAADFDNGYYSNDGIGNILGLYDLGLRITEGMIASGDSGGPAFINGLLAGIASYTSSISSNTYSSDINNIVDSSFGEIGAWQRISFYSEWIDKTIRANLPDTPTSADEVELEVTEGETYVYFFVEYSGIRELVDGILSVDYVTINGSAIAGEDYIETTGTLNLYSDESYAVIPVEILDDDQYEVDEIFYLQISNPVNGTFENDVITLTASRTIHDDDVWMI